MPRETPLVDARSPDDARAPETDARARARVHPTLSVVVPVLNEADNVAPLVAEIAAAMAAVGPAEAIFVDDGSTDDTVARMRALNDPGITLRLVRHAERSGQSAAIRSGVKAARAAWIATLDGDGQNDPADIAHLWRRAAEPDRPALVVGLRVKRRDSWVRRAGGRIANAVRQGLLRDGCSDTGCGLKVFRRDAFLDLPAFAGMHRFLPALMQIHGHRVAFVPVGHRPRGSGTSKYGTVKRGLVGVIDLLGVYWLKRRTAVPKVREDE